MADSDDRVSLALAGVETKRQGDDPTSIRNAIDALLEASKDLGMSRTELERGARVVTGFSQHGIRTVGLRRVIKSLIPRGDVPAGLVVDLVGSLQSMPARAKVDILKFLVLCYDYIEESAAVIRALYGVFFGLLTYESLRGSAAHLLYRATRQADVKQFRVNALLRLAAQDPDDKSLLSLLLLYKDYSHEHIPVSAPAAGRLRFPNPDKTWYDAILHVRANAAAADDDEAGQHVPAQREPRDARPAAKRAPLALTRQLKRGAEIVVSSGAKRRRMYDQVIPEAGTTSSARIPADAVKIDQISTIADLADSLSALALPDQLAAILGNRYLQHAVSVDPSRSGILRIAHWLAYQLEQEFTWKTKGAAPKRARRLLEGVVAFTRFMKEPLVAFEDFLFLELPSWDGSTNRDLMLELVAYLHPTPYEKLYARVLHPLQSLFSELGPDGKYAILTALTAMVRRWATIDWMAYVEELRVVNERTAGGMARAQHIRVGHYQLVDGLSTSVDYFATIRNTIMFVDSLCVVGLLGDDDHPLVQSAVLSFFELVSQSTTDLNLPFVVVPSPALVFRMLFAPTAMPISRMAGILVRYKAALAILKSEVPIGKFTDPAQRPVLSFDAGQTAISDFNAYSLDFGSILWFGHLFKRKENEPANLLVKRINGALQAAVANEVPDSDVLLTFTRSLAFASFAHDFLTETQRSMAEEDPDGDVGLAMHPSAIIDDSRLIYLDFLNDRGLEGLRSFFYKSVKSLIRQRGGEELPVEADA